MKRKIGFALGGLAVLGAAVAATPGTAGTGGGATVVTTTGDPDTGLEISVTAARGQANIIDTGMDLDHSAFRDREAGITEESEYCTQVRPTAVRCDGTITLVTVNTGDKNDRALMSASEIDTQRLARGTQPPRFVALLGRGNDRSLLSAAEMDTNVKGQAGKDRLIGREGSQKLAGGGGPDFLAGGAGEGDVCNGGPAADKEGPGCEETISIP